MSLSLTQLFILVFFPLASDCRQRRPGESFNKKGKSNPEVIDKEYEAFLEDMGIEPPSKKKEREDKKKAEANSKYVPPMGDLSKALSCRSGGAAPPLMLTNGSHAPGAASAHARAISAGQQTPGGTLQVMGKSIFGGKLTRLTSGYKSHSEMEMEREKRRQEYENRPVPLEWQVEKYEKGLTRRHEEYLKGLEVQASEARRAAKLSSSSSSPSGRSLSECLARAPPPPPPGSGPPPQGAPPSSSQVGDLPNLIGTPMFGMRR